MTSTFSTARAALDAHHEKIAALRDQIEQARRPLMEHDGKLAVAREDQNAAEASHEEAVKAEAEAFVIGNASEDHATNVRHSQTAVDRCKRVVKALEGKRADLERALRDIELNAGISGSALEDLVAGVISEVADSAFDEMQAARTKAAAAEAKFLTLKALILSRKWYALAERLNMKFNSMPVPFWGDQGHPDWPSFLTALESDAHAQVPL